MAAKVARGVLGGLFKGSARARLRWALRLITPFGIEWALHLRDWHRVLARREEYLATHRTSAAFTEDEGRTFLAGRGLDPRQVEEGSMPARTLDFLERELAKVLPPGPVLALQIGNFVGLSLAFLTSLCKQHDAGSVVVSVDPDITHRGVEHPQRHVLALLEHFGLSDHSLVIPGFSLEQGFDEKGTDQEADLSRTPACTHTLASLSRLAPRRFGLALVDGLHYQEHLQRELAALDACLADEALVILDDLDNWPDVQQALAKALSGEMELLASDGRAALLRKASGNPDPRPRRAREQ